MIYTLKLIPINPQENKMERPICMPESKIILPFLCKVILVCVNPKHFITIIISRHTVNGRHKCTRLTCENVELKIDVAIK